MMTKEQTKNSKTRSLVDMEIESVTEKTVEPTRTVIHSKPGLTKDGKSFDHVVRDRIAKGDYRLQILPAEVTGTQRPIEVYQATRGLYHRFRMEALHHMISFNDGLRCFP